MADAKPWEEFGMTEEEWMESIRNTMDFVQSIGGLTATMDKDGNLRPYSSDDTKPKGQTR